MLTTGFAKQKPVFPLSDQVRKLDSSEAMHLE